MEILIDIAESRFNRLKEGKIPHGCIAEKMILKAVKEGVPTVEAIPKAEVKKFLEEGAKDVSNKVLAIVREDYIHKSDYENRLKADLKAILVELQLEIEEKAIRKQGIDSGFEYDYEFISSEEVIELIQQKINKLKEVEI